MNNMLNRLGKKARPYLEEPIVRYLIMAIVLVLLEVIIFFFLNSVLGILYLVATPLSMSLSIVLNWYFGRRLIFRSRRYKAHAEFTLVAISSLGGIGIQLLVTFVSVEYLDFVPILGKLLAISITFFFNFFFRRYFIYANPKS